MTHGQRVKLSRAIKKVRKAARPKKSKIVKTLVKMAHAQAVETISNVDARRAAMRERFALAYVGNGGNATAAFLTARDPGEAAVTQGTAATEGWRLLRESEVKTRVEALRSEWAASVKMEGDEALGLISLPARVDTVQCFNVDGSLVPFTQWPLELRLCVKSMKFADGQLVEIRWHDALKARELMAIAGGKLRQGLDVLHQFDHAAYLGKEPPKGD